MTLKEEIILNYLGGPNVITEVLLSRKKAKINEAQKDKTFHAEVALSGFEVEGGQKNKSLITVITDHLLANYF